MHFWELCRAGKEVIVRAASVRRADEIRARCSPEGQLSRLPDGAMSGEMGSSAGPSLRGELEGKGTWRNPGDPALFGLVAWLK